jgi:hypothetical protein
VKDMFFKKKKDKEKPKCDKPTHWTLGWSGDLELGFADGTYLPRKAALLLNPEYFDENGNPKMDMLPIGKK